MDDPPEARDCRCGQDARTPGNTILATQDPFVLRSGPATDHVLRNPFIAPCPDRQNSRRHGIDQSPSQRMALLER